MELFIYFPVEVADIKMFTKYYHPSWLCGSICLVCLQCLLCGGMSWTHKFVEPALPTVKSVPTAIGVCVGDYL